ncbi:MAG: hypothetical protein ACI9MR_003381 [Myxococcota bacterium]|jgi:hypothetical protein
METTMNRMTGHLLVGIAMAGSATLAACSGDDVTRSDYQAIDRVDVSLDGLIGGAESNACGGLNALTVDGADVVPEQPCGACGDGFYVCTGAESLACAGASEANGCGGCSALAGPPGAACGACGATWECEGDGVVCSESLNSCGGCQALDVGAEAEPNVQCTSPEDDPGVWRCTTLETLECISFAKNGCGGTSELAEVPATPCGPCGLGVRVCDGREALVCHAEDKGQNGCGGCRELEGDPGEACDRCGGAWRCVQPDLATDPDASWADDAVFCDGPPTNACGGCEELAGAPGDDCGQDGPWVCGGGFETVRCGRPGDNLCGGQSVLLAKPGTTCGPCGDGQRVCSAPNTLTCLDASELNACGSCGFVGEVPGTPCGAAGIWTCYGTTMGCAEPGINPCGGTEQLVDAGGEAIQIGAACGACAFGIWKCAVDDDGDILPNAAVCPYDDPQRFHAWPDVDKDGAGDEDADPVAQCVLEPGFVRDSNDCDDGSDAINFYLLEVCDGLDNNCDGETDEATAIDGLMWYPDLDEDGQGGTVGAVIRCDPPPGYKATSTDCDDGNPQAYLGAGEVEANGVDEDCDGTEICYVDIDGDGYPACNSSDRFECEFDPYASDEPPALGEPGDLATRVLSPILSCTWGDGDRVTGNRWPVDCADSTDDLIETMDASGSYMLLPATNPWQVFPGAIERCDGVCNSCGCGGEIDYDFTTESGFPFDAVAWVDDWDGDGWAGGPRVSCINWHGPGWEEVTVTTLKPGDCEPRLVDSYPGAPEVCGDNIDNDCDGVIDPDLSVDAKPWYRDRDGDGVGERLHPVTLTRLATADHWLDLDEGTVSDGETTEVDGALDLSVLCCGGAAPSLRVNAGVAFALVPVSEFGPDFPHGPGSQFEDVGMPDSVDAAWQTGTAATCDDGPPEWTTDQVILVRTATDAIYKAVRPTHSDKLAACDPFHLQWARLSGTQTATTLRVSRLDLDVGGLVTRHAPGGPWLGGDIGITCCDSGAGMVPAMALGDDTQIADVVNLPFDAITSEHGAIAVFHPAVGEGCVPWTADQAFIARTKDGAQFKLRLEEAACEGAVSLTQVTVATAPDAMTEAVDLDTGDVGEGWAPFFPQGWDLTGTPEGLIVPNSAGGVEVAQLAGEPAVLLVADVTLDHLAQATFQRTSAALDPTAGVILVRSSAGEVFAVAGAASAGSVALDYGRLPWVGSVVWQPLVRRVVSCEQPEGFAPAGDCADDDFTRAGGQVTEVCDFIDNNCDGGVDDVTLWPTERWWLDDDADGWATGDFLWSCAASLTQDGDAYEVAVAPFLDRRPGSLLRDDLRFTHPEDLNGLDCDDSNPGVHPFTSSAPNAETVADGIDQDCDGLELCWRDQDGDGYVFDLTGAEAQIYRKSPDLSCTYDASADPPLLTSRGESGVRDCNDCDETSGAFSVDSGAGCVATPTTCP